MSTGGKLTWYNVLEATWQFVLKVFRKVELFDVVILLMRNHPEEIIIGEDKDACTQMSFKE